MAGEEWGIKGGRKTKKKESVIVYMHNQKSKERKHNRTHTETPGEATSRADESDRQDESDRLMMKPWEGRAGGGGGLQT